MCVNIVCFGVFFGSFFLFCLEGGGLGCFELEYEMYTPRAHLKKGALRPPYYYYYVSIPWCSHCLLGRQNVKRWVKDFFGGEVQFQNGAI